MKISLNNKIMHICVFTGSRSENEKFDLKLCEKII